MKLVDLQPESWYRSAPFVDTLLLPISPLRMEGKLFYLEERTRVEEVCELTEKQLMGRVLLLPTLYYLPWSSERVQLYLHEILAQFGKSDFSYLVMVYDPSVVSVPHTDENSIEMLRFAWHSLSTAQEQISIDEEVQQLTTTILNLWATE